MNLEQNSFITNQDKFLSEIINGILPKCNSVDILVGYFYYSGFDLICEAIKDKHLRILVGLDVDVKVSSKVREIDQFVKLNQSRRKVRDNYYDTFIKLFNDTDYFDSYDKIESFKLFYSKIIDGSLEIKKTEDPCHAKMYLFEYNDLVNEEGEHPGSVITGSSNLSFSGLVNRTEINARFNDKQSYIDGNKIFNELWSSAVLIADHTNIDDFNNEVIEHIWFEKLYSPYLMYIRVLQEYFSIPDRGEILTPHDITDGRFFNLRYQTDAVLMALNALDNHNGVIIADVVGLGKSIIGSTVATNLRLRTIIISPPHLKSQWEEYASEFGFNANIFSSGQIVNALDHFRKLVKENEQFLIIVDEAHKYRNEETKDYANLHNLCLGNKVILLTATPFNNKPSDIYSMLKLFQIPTKSTLKTVENLGEIFKALIASYKDLTNKQRNKELSELEVKIKAAEIAKTIRSIIMPLVIRRSRIDLEEIDDYKKDLKKQNIKTIIPNDPILLEYDLGSLKGLYINTLEQISMNGRFKSARYKAISYVLPGKEKELEKELKTKADVDFNLLIGRQKNLSDFMRRLLVRRFESSVAAFKESVKYMISSYTHMLQWIEKRDKIPVYKKGVLPSVEDFYESTNDHIEHEISEALEKYAERGFFEIDMQYINRDEFLKDMKSDLEFLESISISWFGSDNQIKEDPKLDSFKELLKEMKLNDPNRKIIVFTEFADTANYLGERLKKEKLEIFKYTSDDASPLNKEIIKSNFDAGYKKELQKNDYHILIATDAISEGYNLHRAGAIFNYDIPYNPTRVIQRIGRINRINKKMFDELYIYNYFPTVVGENETRTKEISKLKMAMIHAIMGEDTKALTEDEELQSFFKDIYNKEINKSEEASWDTKYRKQLNQLKGTEEYAAASKITHRAKTGRKIDKPKNGVLLFGKKGNDYVFKIGNSDTQKPAILSAEDALFLFEAKVEEIPYKVSKDFDSTYQNVKSNLFRQETEDKIEKLRLEVFNKIEHIKQTMSPNKDYIADLITAIENDALSVYDLRFINKLAPKDFKQLYQQIDQSYLNRIIYTINSIEEGDEILVLAEEIIN